MKKLILFVAVVFLLSSSIFAQMSGNQVYNNRENPVQTNTGNLDSSNENQYSVEASVLMNARADSFVAVFGVQEENKTPEQNNTNLDAQLKSFIGELSKIGISKSDIYVDFITQNRVYDFTVKGDTATEVFSGFETKKTISIKFVQPDLFEKIVAIAAKENIFDLIKVDYIVSNSEKLKQTLFNEAVNIIKEKEAKYKNSFGVKLTPVGLSREKYDFHYPAQRYKRYQAFETGNATSNYRSGNQVLQRKSFTFYYEPVDPNLFDKSINPISIEPLVQITLNLRMDYDTERIKAKIKDCNQSIVKLKGFD